MTVLAHLAGAALVSVVLTLALLAIRRYRHNVAERRQHFEQDLDELP